MTTSESIYYLNNNELYRIVKGGRLIASPEAIISRKEKTTLVIDDSYFFYVGMPHVSISGKKLRAAAFNYINVMFPGDMVKNYGVFQGKGFTIIFVVSDNLVSFINENKEMFASVNRITTPFIELCSRYEDFTYSDGIRAYKKSGSEISSSSPDENGMKADDLFSEEESIKTSINIPGTHISRFDKKPYIIPAAILAACYILFVIGQIINISTSSKMVTYYNEILQNVYRNAGITDKNDPYGKLLYKSKQAGSQFEGKRITALLSDMKIIIGEDTKLTNISVRDKSVRVEGIAEDFAKVEQLKKNAEELLKTPVVMDDTKKTDLGVTFIMRYEQ